MMYNYSILLQTGRQLANVQMMIMVRFFFYTCTGHTWHMDLFVRPALEFFQATTIFFGLYLIYYTGTSLFKVFALKLFVNVKGAQSQNV